jgi:hypothetical protein
MPPNGNLLDNETQLCGLTSDSKDAVLYGSMTSRSATAPTTRRDPTSFNTDHSDPVIANGRPTSPIHS